ncbi:MBL fold metallo-hydrolase [Deinococcus cavernae]|uniref:MBL fold metallo-hydrolase n=1 Tax=Deinococcus cavernae TaxID=2320857 RepID=A0A418V695_9DEIO|nr:MBL fold metallo-hydrolase [Deinococcus cavernae]RJF71633.1 MBL fold metallo-hydrolase [Deinococcus cavernae]
MLRARVLGKPGQDNALWVTADSGQGLTRLLLDCGGRTLEGVPVSEIAQVDHLLFSHLHMDHVAGFDDFFRVNFERTARENHVWGPPGTARIMGHRFRGYWWNHAPDIRGTWWVHEIDGAQVQSWRFEAHEAFEVMHSAGTRPHTGTVLDTPQVSVQAVPLLHQGVSLGYMLREPPRMNVNTARLAELGLRGGPWLAQLKSGVAGDLDVNGAKCSAQSLRHLLEVEPGDSAAYFTDFLLSGAQRERLALILSGVKTLFMEGQYAPEDEELALKNHHTTVQQGALLAEQAGVETLVLLHLSRRYDAAKWAGMLRAAQDIFPAARFPAEWL